MVRIQSENTLVELVPEQGAAIVVYRTRLAHNDIDWFVPGSKNPPGSFVMVPFASRIAAGEFTFAEKRVELPANLLGESLPIHGYGWLGKWDVLDLAKDSVTLQYVHPADHWPWSYITKLDLKLSGLALQANLRVVNESDSPMPVGIGFHPFFPVTRQCEIATKVSHQWHLSDALLPKEKASSDVSRWLPGQERIDCVYTGWERQAQILWPEQNRALAMVASEAFNNFVIYSPGEFFCAEPISNMVDGFNMMTRGEVDHGVNVIQPLGELSAWIRFAPAIF